MVSETSVSAATAHSASKLSSLFQNIPASNSPNLPKKPKTLSSLFTNPHTPSPNFKTTPEKFLKIDCKSGKINVKEALNFFDHMLHLKPTPPLSSFNLLLGAVAKKKQYSVVISLCSRLSSSGLLPNYLTLHILLNCFCEVNRASEAFSVLGHILWRGYIPNRFTFTTLIKGWCKEGRMGQAVGLFKKMVKLGIRPDAVAYGTLINGLCRTGKTDIALRLYEEMISRKGESDLICEPDIICYGALNDGLCKEGLIDKAKELFLDMKVLTAKSGQ